jgi:hypothetical protein
MQHLRLQVNPEASDENDDRSLRTEGTWCKL